VKITNLAGKPTVVNFFASYCVPCRQEGPMLAREAERLSGQVVFLGVAYQDFRSDAKRLLAKSGASYPVLFDGQGKTEATWGLSGIPETFVLTASGHVVKHLIGRLSEGDLRQAVSAALSPP
jgi:cytochrome c biogenesis protein CcmG/thiol:disulfide interchange protein DsbE